MTPELWAGAWLCMVVAAAIGRWRFFSAASDLRDLPTLELEVPQIRRAVLSAVVLELPEAADLLGSDPHRAHLALAAFSALLDQVARDVPLERDPACEGVFRLYLGRSKAVPDHRARALELALRLRDEGTELLRELGLGPPAIGLATDDSLTTPLLGGAAVTLGRAPAAALALARRAGAGRILVDGARPSAEAGFEFREGGDERCLEGGAPSRS